MPVWFSEACWGTSSCFLLPALEALDVAVGFQAGEEDVEEPEREEEEAGDQARGTRPPELAPNGGPPAEQQHTHCEESEDGEECDGEG